MSHGTSAPTNPLPNIPAFLQDALQRDESRMRAEQELNALRESQLRPQLDMEEAAYAFSDWSERLGMELKQQPTATQAAERFGQLADAFVRIISTYHLADFYDILDRHLWDEWGEGAEIFRVLLRGSKGERDNAISVLWQSERSILARTVIFSLPCNLLACVNAYFRVRNAADPLTVGELRGLLGMSNAGVRHLEQRRPSVAELRAAMAVLHPDVEFNTKGMQRFVSRLDQANATSGIPPADEWTVDYLAERVTRWIEEDSHGEEVTPPPSLVPVPMTGEGGQLPNTGGPAVQQKGQAGAPPVEPDGPYEERGEFGLRVNGVKLPFQSHEAQSFRIIRHMWPGVEGKEFKVDDVKKAVVKKAVVQKADKSKWATNEASKARKPLGRCGVPFTIEGDNDRAVLWWQAVPAGILTGDRENAKNESPSKSAEK